MKTSLWQRMAASLSALTLAGSLTIVVSTSVFAATVPSGFTDALVASGLTWPTAIAVANDGRVFATEQSGALKVIKDGTLTLFIKLTVKGEGGAANEQGLVGITLDPSFATNNFLYAYYTVPSSGNIASHNRVSRFTANGDVAVAGSEKILLEVPGPSSGAHNGGGIHFGADGKLYIAVGDHSNSGNGQSMTTIKGKLLRINVDGTIPSDNPFFTTATGQNRAIWALGFRNPYRFGVQPGTGKILINDVGNGEWEEINLGVAGGNYGWNLTEGPTTDPRFLSPLFAYPHSAPSGTPDGCAIVGGAFYNPSSVQFPSFYVGKYFFADYCKGWMRVLDPATGTASDFATGVVQPVDLQVGNDGALYYLDRFAGSVRRITFASSNTAPTITSHPSSVTVAVGQPASFSVSAEGTQPLTYQWQRNNGDIAGATAATYTLPSAALSDSGASFRAVVTNAISTATSNSATLTVITSTVPTGNITAPAEGSTYSAGDTIAYVGTGTDPEDGELPASAFTWRVDFHHDTHFHPFVTDTSGTSGSFTIPTLSETSANVWYRIHLTVRDSSGLTSSSFRDVLPNTVNLAFQTSPPGLQVRLDGPPLATPASIESVVGLTRTIGVVSPQTVNNQTYVFSSWAHGGTATQDIQTPTVDTTYIANYVPSDGGAFSDAFDRPDSPDVGNGWLELNDGLSISGNELRNAPTKNLFQMAIVPTFSSTDQTVAASFATINGNNSQPRFGVVLCYQDPQNYYLVSRRGGGTSVVQISRVVNGSETALATKSLPNPVSNTFFRLEGQANGATLTLKLDGVQMLSVVDSTFSAGNVGIGLGSMSTTGQTHRADNFAASGSGGATAPTITSHPSSVTVAVGQPASFSVSAEGTQPLTFQWQRDGVGIAGATAATYTLPSAALSDSGASFRAVVTNSISAVTSNSATLTVVSSSVPTGNITAPAEGSTYSAGDTIAYVGTGSDPEDGTLPASAFTWRVDFHHDTHFYPFVTDTSGTSGSFTIPTLGETSANVWYRIHLTVRDSSGLTSSSFRDVLPNTVDLGFQTSPPGLQVRLDGPPLATPASIESVVGLQRTIGVVSPQTVNNQTYVFSSWAHGGTATQDIQTPTVDTTYIATYVPSDGGAFSDAFDRPDSPDVGNGWLELNEGLSISGNELRNAPTRNLFQMAIVPTFSSADQTGAASFATINGSNSQPRFGVVLHYQDPQNYYLVSRRGGGTSVLQISKVVNGSETVLATKSLPNPVSNTFFRLEGQANGATLTLKLDGVQMLSVVDSTFSAGNVGIGLGSMSNTVGQTHRADNFAASGE